MADSDTHTTGNFARHSFLRCFMDNSGELRHTPSREICKHSVSLWHNFTPVFSYSQHVQSQLTVGRPGNGLELPLLPSLNVLDFHGCIHVGATPPHATYPRRTCTTSTHSRIHFDSSFQHIAAPFKSLSNHRFEVELSQRNRHIKYLRDRLMNMGATSVQPSERRTTLVVDMPLGLPLRMFMMPLWQCD